MSTIRFDVVNDNGDRVLYLEGTKTLVGWIEKGRTLQGQHGPKTEWRFVPSDPDVPAGKVSTRGVAPAYADARVFAAALLRKQWASGPITLAWEPGSTVLGQYKPAERWNGFLCPWLDALSCVQVLDWLNATQPDDQILYTFDEAGALVLDDQTYPDEPADILPPDEDGLYPLGAYGWVWSEVQPEPTAAGQRLAMALGQRPVEDVELPGGES